MLSTDKFGKCNETFPGFTEVDVDTSLLKKKTTTTKCIIAYKNNSKYLELYLRLILKKWVNRISSTWSRDTNLCHELQRVTYPYIKQNISLFLTFQKALTFGRRGICNSFGWFCRQGWHIVFAIEDSDCKLITT